MITQHTPPGIPPPGALCPPLGPDLTHWLPLHHRGRGRGEAGVSVQVLNITQTYNNLILH